MRATREPQLPERAAHNQSLFREINEHIQPHNAAHHWVDPPMPDWVCECAAESCSAPVQMTVAEYEAIREEPNRFFVAPGESHVFPEVELVVERSERYWVVEKFGEAADVSEALDERVGGASSASDERDGMLADRVAWNVAEPRGG